MSNVISLEVTDKKGLYTLSAETDSIDMYHLFAELGVVWDGPWDAELGSMSGECDDIVQLAQDLRDEGCDELDVRNEYDEQVDEEGYSDREREEMYNEARNEERAFRAMMERWVA